MLDFLYRLPMRSFPRCRLVPRLVRASRGASRSFYPIVSCCLLVLFLFVSSLRLVGRLVSPSRLACSFRSSHFAYPWWRPVLSPCLCPSVSSYRLAGVSCLLVSLLFHLSFSSCLAALDRTFLRGACSNINPIEVCGSFPAARSPVVCPLRGHDAVSIPVLRHPVMRR